MTIQYSTCRWCEKQLPINGKPRLSCNRKHEFLAWKRDNPEAYAESLRKKNEKRRGQRRADNAKRDKDAENAKRRAREATKRAVRELLEPKPRDWKAAILARCDETGRYR